MSFFGKEYSFVKQENMEEFVNSMGLPAEEAKTYLNYRPNHKLVQNGDSYTLTSTTPDHKHEVTFKSGVTFDEKVDGSISKSTYTVDGNTMKSVQKSEDGSVFNSTFDYSGNELTVTLTRNGYDGKAVMHYKA